MGTRSEFLMDWSKCSKLMMGYRKLMVSCDRLPMVSYGCLMGQDEAWSTNGKIGDINGL